MRCDRILPTAAGCLIVLADPTGIVWGGSVQLLSQNRGISAATFSGGADQDRSVFAPDFGLFEESIGVSGNDPTDNESGKAWARQISTVTPELMTVFHEVEYLSLAGAWAHYDIIFEALQRTVYHLTYAPTSGSIRILNELQQPIVSADGSGMPLEGELEPGIYTFSVTVHAVTRGLGGDAGEASAEARLALLSTTAIPLPAAPSMAMATVGSIGLCWLITRLRRRM
jgi:hypothetical protein